MNNRDVPYESGIDPQNNNNAGVPAEYANDPDLYWAIQASLNPSAPQNDASGKQKILNLQPASGLQNDETTQFSAMGGTISNADIEGL